jgi:hypothetical protein
MRLKRIYNHDAPKEEWVTRAELCPTCSGKGKVVNEALDGVKDCPDCEDGIRKTQIPPVVTVEVQYAGDFQKFSPKIVAQGRKQGWLSLEGNHLTIFGVNEKLVYEIGRVPGRYELAVAEDAPEGAAGYEVINWYECNLVEREVQDG